MRCFEFYNNEKTFRADNSDMMTYQYFPSTSDNGVMSSFTPEFGGDCKTGQNTFILEPVSSENLHNNRSTRNFWLNIKTDGGTILRSATGASALQHANKFTSEADTATLYGDFLSQRVERQLYGTRLRTVVTAFVPFTEEKIELMRVEVINDGDEDVTFTPITAVPLYARSADNIRDHRNVTSMLHRVYVTEKGVTINPTLTFDERGHRRNNVIYGFFSCETRDGKVIEPQGFCPEVQSFIGEGGAFDNPRFPLEMKPQVGNGTRIDGCETIGAAVFEERTLKSGERAVYVLSLVFGTFENPSDTTEEMAQEAYKLESSIEKYLSDEAFSSELKKQHDIWTLRNNVKFHSGNKDFDNWMYWVGIQPMLRRIYGCSFLPHHDYGKGGRGWRDLWQDCLALIVMDPTDVRKMLLDNCGGIRTDGTNATIIGSGAGEFIADRNGITRVWMDHAMWPFMTVNFYIERSGDFGLLFEKANYFTDRQVMRGEELLKGNDGNAYMGTVLEHLLLENLTAFYDVGEHNEMKLRGADWNDALDMAKERGESVAFTAAYAGNLKAAGKLLRDMSEQTGIHTVTLMKELSQLIWPAGKKSLTLYDSVDNKQEVLTKFCRSVAGSNSGLTVDMDVDLIASDLEEKANWIICHIREEEWITDDNNMSRMNSYYDNNGRRVEGTGRMMLTGQVFSIMSGTADDEMVRKTCEASDYYLYDPNVGGYKLNTDFGEIKTDMGRMFGFAYGQKENGAVFSHMAVMYGNSLYSRGFAKEGFKVINSLYEHASDSVAAIFPGIPEYFDAKGRGLYHYLTGAGSWLIMTVLCEMFGVKGEYGNLKLEPKLMPDQFSENNSVSVEFVFNGRAVKLIYRALTNPSDNPSGIWTVKKINIKDSATIFDGCVINSSMLRNEGVTEITADIGGN